MSNKRNREQPQNKEIQLQNNKIQLQVDNTVIFSMEQTKLPTIYGKTVDTDIHNKISGMISPVLSQLPSIAKSVQGLQSYEAVFSPQMKEMLKNGVATIHADKQGALLPQIIHTGKDGQKGQIIKKVRLKSGMTPANIVLLGWQIASIITAQKHLSNINERLAIISKDIKDIKGFLKDEFFSQIESRIRATINLMTTISKNPDFFQEFKDFHAQSMGANMEKTDELILRLDKMISTKLTVFSQEIFKEKGDIDKTVQKYQNQVQEITSLFNLSLQLIQIQHILCMIYAFYSENTIYAKTWRESLNEHQDTLKEKIKKFETIAKKKIETLDYKMPLWQAALSPAILAVGTPIIVVNEGLALLGKAESIMDYETDTDRAKKEQKAQISNQFNNLSFNSNQLFDDMQKQFDSIDSEYRVIIDLNNGVIENIRLLE